MSEDEETLHTVRRKAERIHRWRGRKPSWHYIAHAGALGWMFVLPLIAFTYLGHLASEQLGRLWPAITGLVLGVALGGYLVWRQLRADLREEGD